MINAKLQNLYNIKNDIGTAIVNKGGTITESTPFYSYAGQIDNIITTTPDNRVLITDANNKVYTLTSTIGYSVSNNEGSFTFGAINPIKQSNSTNYLYTNMIPAATTAMHQSSTNTTFISSGTSQIGLLFNNSVPNNIYVSDINGNKYTHSTAPVLQQRELKRFFGRNILPLGSYSTLTVAGDYLFVAGQVASNNFGVYRTQLTDLNRVLNPGGGGSGAFFLQSSGTDDMVSDIANNSIYITSVSQWFGTNIGKYDIYNLTRTAFYNTSLTSQVNRISFYNGNLYATDNQGSLMRFGPNLGSPLQLNSMGLTGRTFPITLINNFIFVGANNTIRKYVAENLSYLGQSTAFNQSINAITANNGFVYASGESNALWKIREDNLAQVGFTTQFGGRKNILIKDGFIVAPLYSGGVGLNYAAKLHESNLAVAKEELIDAAIGWEKIDYYGGFVYGFAGTNFGGSNTGIGMYPFGNDVSNIAPNQWILNNSATGKELLKNVSMLSNGTVNGTIATVDEANISLLQNSNSSSGFGTVNMSNIIVDNGFVYAITGTGVIRKQPTDGLNLQYGFMGNTYSGAGNRMGYSPNAQLLYTSQSSQLISVFMNNLVLANRSSPYYGNNAKVQFNNNFIYYASGESTSSALWRINAANINQQQGFRSFSTDIPAMAIHNNFVYISVGENSDVNQRRRIHKLHESNLQNATISVNLGEANMSDIKINNGFLYVKTPQGNMAKLHADNLVVINNFTGNPFITRIGTNGGDGIFDIKNNFIYVPTQFANSRAFIYKYHEGNGVFVARTLETNANTGQAILSPIGAGNAITVLDNGIIFTSNGTQGISSFTTNSTSFNQLPAFRINRVKEE